VLFEGMGGGGGFQGESTSYPLSRGLQPMEYISLLPTPCVWGIRQTPGYTAHTLDATTGQWIMRPPAEHALQHDVY